MKTTKSFNAQNFSLIATIEDIYNGIEDEYGVVYSKDGKRLLKCNDKYINEYSIKYGTIIICDKAFFECRSLSEIHIPDSVTKIGNMAFERCSSISEIYIPDSVTKIGNMAFCGCNSLLKIHIPNSVTEIEDKAFSCTSIEEIQIPDSVEQIGYEAFGRCKLTEIRVPNSVTHIGEKAFYMCKYLHYIYISSSVSHIEKNSFMYCRYIHSIHVDKENQHYDSRNNCNAIIETNTNTLIVGCASTIIPDSITAIGAGAFGCQRNLTNIQIPCSVKHIGAGAFFECYSLKKIFIPDSVTQIGVRAFRDCYRVESIQVDIKNKYYDSRNDCNAIIETKTNTIIVGCTSTIISDTVTHIGCSAFSCCSFSTINIPNSVTSIGDRAFDWCNNLTRITIPNSVTSIGDEVFEGCDKLSTITIPISVTHIGNHAFAYCESLSEIIIPKGSRSKFENLLPASLHKNIIEKSEGNDIITHHSTKQSVLMKSKRRYGEFAGTHAQDVAGFDDNTIYDAFEGDADNYWNID